MVGMEFLSIQYMINNCNSLSVEEEDMANSGRKSRKAQAIREGEEDTQINLAIVLVGVKIEL